MVTKQLRAEELLSQRLILAKKSYGNKTWN